MSDVTQLTSQLFTGGALADEEDLEQLVDLGITAVIDLRLWDDRNLFGPDPPNAANLLRAHPDVTYLHNGTSDDGVPKSVSWFKRSWDFALPILSSGGVVSANCMNGHNRGPSTAAFLLMAYYGTTEADAFALITQRRPVATLRYLPDAAGAIVALGLSPTVLAGGSPSGSSAF